MWRPAFALAFCGCYQAVTLTSDGGSDSGTVSATATMTAGDAFACKLDGGALVCWGRNTDGEILGFSGPAATTPQTIPGAWQSVDAGAFHACAIAMSGELHCWGRDDSGQVDGVVNDPLGDTEIDFDNHHAWLHVAAGRDHTCAIASDRSLYCWGNNSSGERGTQADGGLAPFHLPGPDDWSLVATGTHTSCAVSDSRGLMCWGANGLGQLGLDHASPTELPAAVAIAMPITSVALARDTGCAVSGDELFCWGLDSDGQAGQAPATSTVIGPVVASTMTTGWKRVESSAALYLCGIRDDANEPGQLWCWGRSDLGGLGNGQFFSTGQFTKIATGATALAVGFVDDVSYSFASNPFIDFIDLELTCAVLDGTATCWGDDRFGELGDGTITRVSAPKTVPIGANIQSLVAGVGHVCALDTATVVHCWGSDTAFELGGSVPSCPMNTQCDGAVPQDVTQLTNVSQIVAGRDHTCALHDGSVRCWGASSNHRLGGGNANVNDITINGGLVRMRAGGETTCADDATAIAQCFGSVLPLPSTFVDISAQAPYNLTNALAFGADFGCAQFTTGSDPEIACAGDNSHGQLGNNMGVGSSNDMFVNTGLTGTSITVGPDAEFACAAATAGDIRCWGLNDRGQFGTPPSNLAQANAPTMIVPGTNCTSVAAGTDGGCAVCGGALSCWGGDMEGQVGDGVPQTTVPIAPAMIDPGPWSLVVAGERFFCGLRTDQSVACWGLGAHGELGNGGKSANHPRQSLLSP